MVDSIPTHSQYSLNIRGLADQKNRDDKMLWISSTFKHLKNLGAVHFQETHLKTTKDAMSCFRRLSGKIIGVSNATNHGTGVLTWIPAHSPIYDLVSDVYSGPDGRWAVMKITTPTEVRTLVNIYAPAAGSSAREDFYDDLNQRLSLFDRPIVMGDHNYAPESLVNSRPMDRLSLVHNRQPKPPGRIMT